VYDYFLGGSHNFAVDRDMADQITKSMPEAIRVTHANRSFLRRAVHTLTTLEEFASSSISAPASPLSVTCTRSRERSRRPFG
jgi:S-adenosyl methyltransferase